ncbi:uncharacterized protein YndB with AHSA1/START domain [Lipingzhangella halophila]|uniref:Uncharacterized protein YndB with AHSA1/START domain n=1 Tax=Lipingzhangella halophila TaxID=1783352 RepID=A0A7W7W283_9ACTN|nr:SRPBCC domain-containing protein [Lipingzhangella halophila]MBB4931486.1 uncharacterized protein YndB with AHSA1/START domain [Lipingzhangella halophila]
MTAYGTWHDAQEGGGHLRFERRFRHPVEKVWRAITEQDQLAAWMPGQVEIEPRQGGTFRWNFPDQERIEPHYGTVTAFEPPRLLEIFTPGAVSDLDWVKDQSLRFELRSDPEGCLLVFTATVEDRASAASFAAGWQTCLAALHDVVNGTPVELDESPDRYVALFEEYTRRFGLCDGTAERTGDGWTVRFERQFMLPGVDAVWAALTGGDEARLAEAGGEPPLPMTNDYVPAAEVTEVEPPTVVEYAWRSGAGTGGRVRWELREGPGFGARIVLTQTLPGSATEERLTALAAWHTHLEVFARSLQGEVVCPWPEERTQELREYYANAAVWG